MGINQQPDDFSCGPYALMHGLTALGVLTDASRLARVARTHWSSGTDEIRLAKAARGYGLDLPLVRFTDEKKAQRYLTLALAKGLPVLVCVDGWEHWVTVVHHARGRFVVLDSREDPVIQVLPWRQLGDRIRYVNRDEDDLETPRVCYDLLPLTPRTRHEIRARFTVTRARALRRPENRDLARSWDAYLSDLTEICRPRTGRHLAAISMGELLRRHGAILIERVLHWHGDVERSAIERVLRNFRFVADTYGMVVPATSTRRATMDIAILLTLWAGAQKPVPALYTSDRPKRPRGSRAKAKSKKR